jgi:hypothetical protein
MGPRVREDDLEIGEEREAYFSSAVRSANDVVSSLVTADPEK